MNATFFERNIDPFAQWQNKIPYQGIMSDGTFEIVPPMSTHGNRTEILSTLQKGRDNVSKHVTWNTLTGTHRPNGNGMSYPQGPTRFSIEHFYSRATNENLIKTAITIGILYYLLK